jgi:hypothetical protein
MTYKSCIVVLNFINHHHFFHRYFCVPPWVNPNPKIPLTLNPNSSIRARLDMNEVRTCCPTAAMGRCQSTPGLVESRGRIPLEEMWISPLDPSGASSLGPPPYSANSLFSPTHSPR